MSINHSPAELELVKFAKVRTFKTGDRQEYLASLLKGIDKILDKAGKKKGDELYDQLSQEAQEWYQSCIERQESNPEAKLPEFEAAETEEDDDDADQSDDADGGDAEDSPVPDEDEDEPASKAASKRPAKAAKAVVEDEDDKPAKRPARKAESNGKAAKAPAKGRNIAFKGDGKVDAILEMIWKHPRKKPADIYEMLSEKDVEVSMVTINTVRNTLTRNVKFLTKKGVIDDNPFAKA